MSFAHLGDVLAEVEPLGRRFADAGYRLFLVGGIVRDQWLDESLDGSSDIDLTTDALPGDIKSIVADFADDIWTQGEKFGTIGLRAAGRDYEITTHRAESYNSDSRKPVVSFGDDIAVDLSRRDFTVNAMAIELPDGDLVDPHDGVGDLVAHRLRTPLSADISFSDDPLRMLRAARFAARFTLVPDDEILESATRLHERLRIVAIERIGVEMRRLLALENAEVGLRFLADTGLLREVLAYGEPALGSAVQPRLDAALALAAELDPYWQVRLAAIGVAVFDDTDGVNAMCRRLRLSRDDERLITRTTKAAMQLLEGSTDAPTVRRWLATSDFQHEAITLAGAIGDGEHVADFHAAVAELKQYEPHLPSFLDGTTIMDELGVSPGPAIGQATAFLHECYFEHGPLTEAEQLARLRSWWADRATNS